MQELTSKGDLLTTSILQTAQENQGSFPARVPGRFVADGELAKEVLRAQGQHGRIAELARERGVDRRRLYDVLDRAEAAVEREFEEPEQEATAAERAVQALPDEHVICTISVTVGYLKRVVIALR